MSGLLILVGVMVMTVVPLNEFTRRELLFPAPLSAWALIGTIVLYAGAGLRVWSIRTLRTYFTELVEVQNGQSVVASGPYRWILHPTYAGGLLACIGTALLLQSRLTILLTLTVMLPIYVLRIPIARIADTAGRALLGIELAGPGRVGSCRSPRRAASP